MKNKKIKDVIIIWSQYQKQLVKESTYSHYLNIINNHILPYFKNMYINKITSEDIIRFNNYLLLSGNKKNNKSLNPKTVKDIDTILKQILKFSGNEIKIKSPKTMKNNIKVFTKEEYSLLKEYCLNNLNSYTLGIIICLNTGLRLGEICSLKWEDINLENRTIKINHTILRIKDYEDKKSKIIINTPKTATSSRIIPINNFLFFLLKKFQSSKHNYVLTNCSKFIEPRCYYRRYKTILKKLNLTKYNFHALRHTFATMCTELGFDTKSLSEILGHSNIKTTLTLYVHPSLDLKKDYMERLCRFNM